MATAQRLPTKTHTTVEQTVNVSFKKSKSYRTKSNHEATQPNKAQEQNIQCVKKNSWITYVGQPKPHEK